MKNAQPIELKTLSNVFKKYEKDKVNTVIRHALSQNTIDELAKNQDRAFETNFSFSLDLKTMPVANQKRSGRCWIFAATNVLREMIAKKCNIESFELSQSYVAFYDKLE